MNALLSLLVLSIVGTDDEPFLRWHWAVDDGRVAIGGYDPVAYHTLGEPLLGRAELESVHAGVHYRFGDHDHLERFEDEPERYLPAFGGWCAFGLSLDVDVNGSPPTRIAPDPTLFLIEDDRLLLFAQGAGWNGRQSWLQGDRDASTTRAEAWWANREALASRIGEKPAGLNARAPLETAQFDFFIGEWDSNYAVRASLENEARAHLRGRWSARYGWQGYAIYDDWVQLGAPPNTSGPAIRSYDPRAGHWVMHYIPINAPMSAVWRMTGEFDERGELHGELELTDPQGRPFLQRIHFRDIRTDHFTWSCDRSYDAGETWIVDWGVGSNRRID